MTRTEVYVHKQLAPKFGEVRLYGSRVMRADKQTDRQTDKQTNTETQTHSSEYFTTVTGLK